MTRKVTTQQRRRIQQRQERFHAQNQGSSENITGEINIGLVIAHFGTAVDVEMINGQIKQCRLRQHLPPLVPGDKVAWQEQPSSTMGIVVALEPRQSQLIRYEKNQNERTQTKKVVAANLTQVLVTFAVKPILSSLLLDQYLAAVELSKLDAVIIMNKIDLVETAEEKKALTDFFSIYEKIGYPVCFLSTQQGTGMQELPGILSGQMSVFVGPSGVGKSALIKKILSQAPPQALSSVPNNIKTAKEPTSRHMLGIHTTSTARLYHCDPQTDIIDSPGVREFGLSIAKNRELLQGFREFMPYLNQCKFRNCRHLHESHCAIKLAVAEGNISKHRLENYLALIT